LAAAGPVEPPTVEDTIPPGGSIVVDKDVTTPEIPPVVDICLLEDETGSFADDIANLQGGTTAGNLYDTITATSPGAQFAVAGFRDYPVDPYGFAGDWVYHLLGSMSPAKADWLNGIAGLTANGGNDIPEAQYDAIVAAAGPGSFTDPTLGSQGNCGWRDPGATPGVQRVLVVVTDAQFHPPDGTHVNDQASTIAALDTQDIIVIGLKAPGAGAELDALAGATGGSVQPLSSDGANIAQAILDGLADVTTDVWWETSLCDPQLVVSLAPTVQSDVPGGTTVDFTETIAVPDGTPPGTYVCTVTFIANNYPAEGAPIGTEEITIHVPDVVPPEAACAETVNPSGNNVPKAPGKGGQGQNQDGFYELQATDNFDPTLDLFVTDTGSGVVFGPFPSGTRIKYTEANGAVPSIKAMGGPDSAVDWHIKGQGDAQLTAVDDAGNVSAAAACLVPPPPK
jgi:hypothetical protein